MERKIILASHGKLASGFLSSLELICGTNRKVSVLDCYLTENFDLTHEVAKIMKENTQNELIVITDLFGGSVNNEFLNFINQPNFYLVAGLNLPFLIELTTAPVTNSVEELIQETLNRAKETIQFCNESIHQDLIEDDF